MVPGRVQTLRIEADQPGHLRRPVHRVLRPVATPTCAWRSSPSTPADFETWKANQLAPYAGAGGRHAGRRRRGRRSSPSARAATRSTACTDDRRATPVIAHPDEYVYSGAAPNLTHLMTRNTFAGATGTCSTEACRDRVWNATPEEFGAAVPAGRHPECLNEVDLREWIRNAPAKKPMYADPTELGPTDGKIRGMPYLGPVRGPDRPDHRLPARAEVTEITRWPSSNVHPRHHRPGGAAPPVTPVDVATACSAGPCHTTGWRSWVFTVDHKKLGIMYGVAAMFVLPRRRHRGAADPGPAGRARRHGARRRTSTTRCSRCTPRRWSSCSSMPMAAAFANYFVPLQIGARDVAFPRINAFGFWSLPVRRHLPQHVVVPRRRRRRRLVHVRAELQRAVLADATASTSGRSACRSPASPR